MVTAEGAVGGERTTHRRHHRRHHRHHHGDQQPHHHHQHHHSGENITSAYSQQQSSSQHRSTAAVDGYGHINDELIFIERGEHSPHRQEPPSGYEYKGKIEVQSYDREIHSQAQAAGPRPTGGPCPPGWTQVVMSGGACGPCPSGGVPYSGQVVGGAQTGAAGYGTATSYGSYGAVGGLPPNCQVVADYVFGSNTGRFVSGGATGYEGQ